MVEKLRLILEVYYATMDEFNYSLTKFIKSKKYTQNMEYLSDTFEVYKKINEEFPCKYGQFLKDT